MGSRTRPSFCKFLPTAHRLMMAALVAMMACSALAKPADSWAELRNRAGNDDVFVMVDTSLSMAEGSGGIMPEVRQFLGDLFANYLKSGDRVIVMSFDSEARVQGVIDIDNAERDLLLVNRLVNGLDSHRIIYYRSEAGVLHEVPSRTAGAILGGGQWTDYCEMWRLAQDAIRLYSDPERRQVFLLLTDGEPAAPPYRPCLEPGVLDTFAAGIKADRFRMGAIALPTGSGDTQALLGRLAQVLQNVSSDREVAARRGLRIIEYRPAEGFDPVRREIAALISSRLDLESPVPVDLGTARKPRISAAFKVVNRSEVTRAIRVSGATLLLEGREFPVQVDGGDTRLPAGESRVITVKSGELELRPGSYTGSIEFAFDGPSRFSPARVAVVVRVLSWWEAFGKYVVVTLSVLFLALLVILLSLAYRRSLEFAPILVEGHYGANTPPTRFVKVGETVGFGGGGLLPGELFVDGPAPSGHLRRDGADDWSVSWDLVEFKDYLPGTAARQSEYSAEDWKFSVYPPSGFTLSGVPSWLSSIRRRSSGK